MSRRRFAIDFPRSTVVVGVTDDGRCGFVECASMYSPDGPRRGTAKWYQSWATEHPEGIAMCRAVAAGEAHPGILADWIEEHPSPPDYQRFGADAGLMRGMEYGEVCAMNYLRRVTGEIPDFVVQPSEE